MHVSGGCLNLGIQLVSGDHGRQRISMAKCVFSPNLWCQRISEVEDGCVGVALTGSECASGWLQAAQAGKLLQKFSY